MLHKLVFLGGIIFPSLGTAQSIDDEEDRPLTLQFAMAPRDKNLLSFHALTETSFGGKVGFSYSKGEDAVSIFHEPFVSTGSGFSRYSSDRLPYQMFSIKYQYALPKNVWAALNLGRLEIHETKKLSDHGGCYDCEIVYLSSTNGPAMDIDISKTFGSFSMGWAIEILPSFSGGVIAFEYVFKGDSSGILVNSINGSMTEERQRLHAAMVQYARRDYFQPPQLMFQLNF